MAKSAQKGFPKLNLNLLHPQGIPEKLPLRFLKWLISYGRYIIVVVEILVLVAFGARFKLDADLAQIRNKISQRVPYVESLSQDEALIRQTQLRLTTIKKNYDTTPVWKDLIDKVSANLPAGVRLNGLTFEKDPVSNSLQIKMVAQAVSNVDLAVFLNGLKNEEAFKNINLTGVSYEQGEIIFSVAGEVR